MQLVRPAVPYRSGCDSLPPRPHHPLLDHIIRGKLEHTQRAGEIRSAFRSTLSPCRRAELRLKAGPFVVGRSKLIEMRPNSRLSTGSLSALRLLTRPPTSATIIRCSTASLTSRPRISRMDCC